MNGLASARGAGPSVLRVVLLATMLMVAAGTSQADQGGGRGSGRGRRARSGDRNHNGGGGRTHSSGGDRSHNGGGGRTYSGGDDRSYDGGGGRTYSGGGGRTYSGGGRTYGGVERYYGSSVRYYGGGGHYQGGGYYGSYGYRHLRPRAFISFGIGLGLPYYCPPAYRYRVEPYPVEVESGTSIDVSNEPPAGCYYYDRFCDRQFSNLDDYTDHLDGQDHPNTIEVVREDSGDALRTLEFVGGYWSVKR